MVIRQVERSNTFIPDFNCNKELPLDEQITIEIKKWPTNPESQNFRSFKYGSDSSFEIKYNDNLMLLTCIGRIKNLSIDSEGEIKNGEDLANSKCNLSGLISEIREYILKDRTILTPGESKT
jgi:hypothetical protein